MLYPISDLDNVIRLPKVMDITGIKSKSTVYDYIKKGFLPQPIKIGPRSVGWLRSEIESWLELRVAERNSGKEGDDASGRKWPR